MPTQMLAHVPALPPPSGTVLAPLQGQTGPGRRPATSFFSDGRDFLHRLSDEHLAQVATNLDKLAQKAAKMLLERVG